MHNTTPLPRGEALLTVREVAAQVRVRPKTVERWCRYGQLPAVRIGRRYRIRQDDLDAYVASATTKNEG